MKKTLIAALLLLSACNSQISTEQNSQKQITKTSSSESTQVKLNIIPEEKPIQQYFVLIDEGCEFEPVSVDSVAKTPEEAINLLLSFKQAQYGGTGYANTIYQSNLQLESLEINNGQATLNLTGELIYEYPKCDPPQIKSQIENTLLQFENIESVEIYINQELL
ncbi:hypothetical protein GF376_02760 [Candidatus Peregrinibacteria bacterium]|nr:hypothetical protein [Candidatus Peregrinibacteria bacterium]